MQIRTTSPNDAPALLAFELATRAWSGSHVDARSPDFHTLAGVAAPIEEVLARQVAGSMHPCLLVEGDGMIVGRCNLKDIAPAA